MIKNKSVSAARSCECVLYSILLTSLLMVNIISGSASHTFLMTNDHLLVGSFMDAAYHAIKCSLCRLLFKYLLVSCIVTSAAVISRYQWGCRPHAEFLIWSFVGCYFIIVDTMNHFRISGTPYEVNVEKMKDMHICVSFISVTSFVLLLSAHQLFYLCQLYWTKKSLQPSTFFEFHFFNSEIENTNENRRRKNYSLLSSLTLYAMKAQKV